MLNAKRMTITSLTLLILATLFIALTMLSNNLLRGMRLDLTEDDLYTVSAGTENILASIEEPINLYFFFSQDASKNVPVVRTYATRVQELLEEYVLAADGKLILHTIDPAPFSDAEDQATQFGLQAIPVGTSGESLYFGLAGTNAVDDVAVIPFFQPDKEAFLEYELSELIYGLANPKKPVIGLLSTLPMEGGGFNPVTQQGQASWVITEQLNQLFDVRSLGQSVTTIDEDIDVLMLVHPKDLPEQTLYAIDQFVLGGGKALIFIDPHADAEMVNPDPNNPTAAMLASRASSLTPLLEPWGVTMADAVVVGDRRYALPVSAGPNQAAVPHLGILGIDNSGLAQEDVVLAELDTINMALAGYLEPKEEATSTLEPLVTSSALAMPIPTERMGLLQDPKQLQQGFEPTGETYVLAARLQGNVKSAFPNGPPGNASEGENAANEDQQSPPKDNHLSESKAPINLIVIADTDLLTDRLWVRTQNFFGQRIVTAWANNADFVVNALDNLTGNNDLISIRGQAVSARPFTTIDAIEREANTRFLTTEQQLQQELQETERKLGELQTGRSDDNTMIFSPEQQAELDRFQQRKVEIRKQLRKVRRDMDRDIEQVGTVLKVINIGLMPLLLSVLALAVVWIRHRRRTGGGAKA
jgi:ABC-type uncharacterized transport system involved in gliding motility auxiliary subunit